MLNFYGAKLVTEIELPVCIYRLMKRFQADEDICLFRCRFWKLFTVLFIQGQKLPNANCK